MAQIVRWKWNLVTVRVTQSCPDPCKHMDYTVHGILQARILELVAFPFSRGSSPPRDHIQASHIAGGFFTTWATREAPDGKVSACFAEAPGFDPWEGKIPWRRKWQPPPVFLPGEFHGQRSLTGYSLWFFKNSTWLTNTHSNMYMQFLRKLQFSFLLGKCHYLELLGHTKMYV